MTPNTLNPSRSDADLVCYRHKHGAIEIELRAHQPSSPCPSCAQHSSRVHSRYRRKIADLPWAGFRRTFCFRHAGSSVQTNAARAVSSRNGCLGTVERYARRSCRLRQALTWISLALGGRASARLAGRLGLPASRATMLRTLHDQGHFATAPSPQVLGIGEWALKKGHDTGLSFAILRQRESLICFRRATLKR
jgi:transposase